MSRPIQGNREIGICAECRTPCPSSRYSASVTVLDRGSRTSASSRMSRQRTRDTEPELVLRRELHRRGLRYRVEYPVPVNPRRSIDIAFVGIRLADCVDGCFWHGCPAHATWPMTNSQWWRDKIEANRNRDQDTDRLLREHGWESLRLWEHEVATAADRVQVAHTRRRLELQRGAASPAARRPRCSGSQPLSARSVRCLTPVVK